MPHTHRRYVDAGMCQGLQGMGNKSKIGVRASVVKSDVHVSPRIEQRRQNFSFSGHLLFIDFRYFRITWFVYRSSGSASGPNYQAPGEYLTYHFCAALSTLSIEQENSVEKHHQRRSITRGGTASDRSLVTKIEMADHAGEHDSVFDSAMEKITEKFHGHDSSSDSDDDNDKKSPVASVKAKIYRLFGREKPVHKVFGGGKPADVLLWRDKKVSAGVLVFATAIWVLFELLEYHLLTLVCHILILALAVLFLWANASTFINKSPPQIPEVGLPEDIVLGVACALRIEINTALAVFRDIASGKDLKKFLSVIAGLWIFSVLGSCCNFLTLFYISFVLLHTVPVLYEKYEDQVDAFAEKAEAEIKKQYAVLDAKVLSKIPRGPLSTKKQA